MPRTAALGGLVIVALAVIGASPAPATNLSEILAAPPAGYTELARSASVANGAYDLGLYTAYLGATDPIPAAPLTDSGFTRAFSRTWLRPPQGAVVIGYNRRRILTETVEEYAAAGQAAARFEQLRESVLIPDGVTAIDSSFVIPGSIGIHTGMPNETDELFRVFFARGNAVYRVDMISATDDLTSDVLAQAAAQDKLAPAFTTPPTETAPTSRAPSEVPAPGWQALAVLVLGIGIIGFAGLTVVQRRLEAQSPRVR
jgi:hypothetical protein